MTNFISGNKQIPNQNSHANTIAKNRRDREL